MDVSLVVVPFADVERPAIGVSLLKAELAVAGYSCKVHYLNFDLAERIGRDFYNTLSESLPAESLVGEWYFADLVFGDEIPPPEQYLQKILLRTAGERVTADVVRARAVRESFIEDSVRSILASGARIVGFSTTFHQTCCCLAIARRLKEAPHPPHIVFGGANCEGTMGLQMLRSFPWIDHVCTREGDRAFPELVTRILTGGDLGSIPGMLYQGVSRTPSTPDLVLDLDALPDPDYSDYFERLHQAETPPGIKPELLIESSRGCWWGAKHHCMFCGLNGDTMHFRSKSPDRVYAEMQRLSERWGVKKVDCVDNILDLRYLGTLFPRLIDEPLGLEFFYEVKANLRREQIATLGMAGVKTIQPGIESLSSEVLRLMGKGCTAAQNLQLLRWCDEHGILVAWNLLAGFPGESPEEYARLSRWLPLITHLQPPGACSPIRLDRFSPLYANAEALGLVRVRPNAAYFYVYPLSRRELFQLASFFEFDYADGRRPDDYLAGTRREVEKWVALHAQEPAERPRLDALCAGDVIRISDTRPVARTAKHQLAGLAADVYLECDEARSLDRLLGNFADRATAAELQRILNQLVDDQLMLPIDGRYLSLAVFRNRPAAAPTSIDYDQLSAAAAVAAQPLPGGPRTAGRAR